MIETTICDLFPKVLCKLPKPFLRKLSAIHRLTNKILPLVKDSVMAALIIYLFVYLCM